MRNGKFFQLRRPKPAGKSSLTLDKLRFSRRFFLVLGKISSFRKSILILLSGVVFYLGLGAFLYGDSYLDLHELVVSENGVVFKDNNLGIGVDTPLYQFDVVKQLRFNQHAGHEPMSITTLTAPTTTQIDWSRSDKAHVLMGGNTVFSFVSPSHSASLILLIGYTEDVSGATTVTWPANVRWPLGDPVSLSRDDAKWDLLGIYYKEDVDLFYIIPNVDFRDP